MHNAFFCMKYLAIKSKQIDFNFGKNKFLFDWYRKHFTQMEPYTMCNIYSTTQSVQLYAILGISSFFLSLLY